MKEIKCFQCQEPVGILNTRKEVEDKDKQNRLSKRCRFICNKCFNELCEKQSQPFPNIFETLMRQGGN